MEENQQMIADEQYYYGCDNLPHVASLPEHAIPTPIEPDVNQFEIIQQIPNPENVRWSPQEDALLSDAIKIVGYGNWNIIADHVKTRNALQCEDRAHQIFHIQNKEEEIRLPSFSQVSSMASYHLPTNETMRLPPASSMVPQISISQNNHPSPAFFTTMDNTNNNINTSNTSNDNERVLDENEITEDEKKGNAEWFMGKAAKTPERYKRIRNHILKCWRETRPRYLTKTAGRKNLADCGDVNAVGRIHSYLESIQAINVDCITTPTVRKRPVRKSEDGANKKKRRPGYYWEEVYGEDNDEEEGYREKVEYSTNRDGKIRPKRNARKREGFYGDNGRVGNDNDPFTLIPVGYYTQAKDAPFKVEIGSDVLLVMEFHAHLAYTEIIGLLGGRFYKDEEGQNKLKVEYVFPCRSTSTGIQCEMDPVSEMAARELFEQKGLDVVGWYHSHPTFEPQPSIRDIENQTSYQDLFRNEASGDEPFIGFIISPYDQQYANDRSQIQCLHISKRWSTTNQYRLPYACIQQVEQQPQVNQDVFDAFLNLLKEYKDHENKIDMTLSFGNMSRLDKLLSSLRVHLYMDPESCERFLENVKNMVQEHFITQQTVQPVSTDNVVKSLTV
ncbi:hypothetical protein G6F38_000098 [Rhizopus arrhizus]|nr:hypothetical protein G6F38_000098 [Rhizopus arrhizus]